ncbi:MAG TPA: hypothetical protein VNX66_02460 [Candidatus Sulfotelmatobacter sp.]|jgi:hypothetical protein|nr:hypothetical protein [Candidatus Sulfotelmatobacter sp.]
MALEEINLRIGFLMFVAVSVTILFIMSCTDFWKHNYSEGFAFLCLGFLLALLFFRKRKIALATVGLSFLLVSAGLRAAFHPSIPGVLITISALAGLYLIILWDAKRNPDAPARDWKSFFDNERVP